MKRIIEVEVFKFKELKPHVQESVRLRLLMFFKDHVNEDTLFLGDGTIFDESGLKFKGIGNARIL